MLEERYHMRFYRIDNYNEFQIKKTHETVLLPSNEKRQEVARKQAIAITIIILSVRLAMITTTNNNKLIEQTSHFIESNSTSNTRVAPTQ